MFERFVHGRWYAYTMRRKWKDVDGKRTWKVQLSKTVGNLGRRVSDPLVLYALWACKCSPERPCGRIMLNFVPYDGVAGKPVEFSIFSGDSRGEPIYVWRGSDADVPVFTDRMFEAAGGNVDAPWLGSDSQQSVTQYAVQKAMDHGVLPRNLDRKSQMQLQALLAAASGRENMTMAVLVDDVADSGGRDGFGTAFEDAKKMALKAYKGCLRCDRDLHYRVKDDLCFQVAKDRIDSPFFDVVVLLHSADAYTRFRQYKDAHVRRHSVDAWSIVDHKAEQWMGEASIGSARSMSVGEVVACVWERLVEWLPGAEMGDPPGDLDAVWSGDGEVEYCSKYDPELAGRTMVSVDLKTANFVALSVLDGLFDDARSWGEFFEAELTAMETRKKATEPMPPEARTLYSKGKKLRLVLLGKVLPRFVRVVEAAMIFGIARCLGRGLGEMCVGAPRITSSDEVVLEVAPGVEAAEVVTAVAAMLATTRFEGGMVHVAAYELRLVPMTPAMVEVVEAADEQARAAAEEDDEVKVEANETFKSEMDPERQAEFDAALGGSPLPEVEAAASAARGNTFCVLRGAEGEWLKLKHVRRVVRSLALLSLVEDDLTALFAPWSAEMQQAAVDAFNVVSHATTPAMRRNDADAAWEIGAS